MNEHGADTYTLRKLMFRLLPAQILLSASGMVNSLISGFFASNYIGMEGMAAVGLYAPFNTLISAISTMLVGGSVILCGQYLSKNERDSLQNNFSMNLLLSAAVGIAMGFILLSMGIFDLSGFVTRDEMVRPLFNLYVIGQAFSELPYLIGTLMTAFLSLENRGRRITAASTAYLAVNLLLSYLFVAVFDWGIFGLAIAPAIGFWVFMLIQAEYFLSGKSAVRLSLKAENVEEIKEIIRIGFPGAASYGYQTVRGLILNYLLQAFIGSIGVSAYAAMLNLMMLFWAVPTGMQAVSRMLLSVSMGEEDRQTLTDVMRVVFRCYIPLTCLMVAAMIAAAPLMTGLYFSDPSEPVYPLIVAGLRIVPLCMPLSLIYMVFVSYGQSAGRTGFVNILALMDGVVCVAGFAALLIPFIGLNGAYIASVLNGVCTTLYIIGYAWVRTGHFPRNMDELMAIPEYFGASPEERMDISVRTIEEVVSIAGKVQEFCKERGIDAKRAQLAAMALEEMAGNVILHGFTKDEKKHSVDIRVVNKDDDLILRLRDDCVAFDPGEHKEPVAGDESAQYFGIRMIFRIARSIRYQNLLGMNVLTIRI